MSWRKFDKIITNALALAFAAGGIACGVLGGFIFFGSETIFQEICGAMLVACGGIFIPPIQGLR